MAKAHSKKDLAAVELEQSLSHVGKALSLLGGRTRALSVKNNQRIFTIRKYLESVEQRLGVCVDLLQLAVAPDGAPEGRNKHARELTPLENLNEQNESEGLRDLEPRDDFERDYDSSRAPGC